MFLKVICLAVTVAVANADYGHIHGFASSQANVHHKAHSIKHTPVIQVVHQRVQEVQHNEPVVVQQDHVEHQNNEEHHIDYYAHPKYEYAYEVRDPHTHDHKYQHEAREGDAVKGIYSVHQPDGSVRTVEYLSDDKTGFNANVKYEGHVLHDVPEHHHHHHY